MDTFNMDKISANIKKMGIYELRAVARELGISSPTTKKREQLINLISERTKDGINIEIQPLKQGRPYKKLNNVDELISLLLSNPINDNLSKKTKAKKFEDILLFNQETQIIKDEGLNIKIEAKGVVRKNNEKTFFIDQQSNTIIFINEIDGYNLLEIGDYVEGEAKQISSTSAILNNIKTINKQKITEYKKIYKVSETEDISDKTFNFNKKIYEGKNNIYKIDNSKYLEEVKEFINKNKNYTYVMLGCNLCFEDKKKLQELNCTYSFLGDYEIDTAVNFNKILDTISLVSRLEKAEKNVVVFLYDIMTIANVSDLYFRDDFNPIYNHCDNTILVIKRLMNISKLTTNNRSTTTILFYQDIDLESRMFKNEIYKISNKIE